MLVIQDHPAQAIRQGPAMNRALERVDQIALTSVQAIEGAALNYPGRTAPLLPRQVSCPGCCSWELLLGGLEGSGARVTASAVVQRAVADDGVAAFSGEHTPEGLH